MHAGVSTQIQVVIQVLMNSLYNATLSERFQLDDLPEHRTQDFRKE